MSNTYHHGARRYDKVGNWMTKVYIDVPKRAKTRLLLEKLRKLQDREAAPLFPHPSKPDTSWFS